MDSNLRVKPVPTLQSKTVEMLRKYINNTYPLGEKIPGEHELATTLGVNRGTVRSALSILEREGLIIRRRGDGTYTNPHVLGIKTRLEDLVEYKKLIQSYGYKSNTVQLDVITENAADEIAVKLNIDIGTPLLVSKNVFEADGNPVIYVEDSIPVPLIKGKYLKKDLKESVFDFLENQCYQKIAYAFMEIIPRLCGEDISKILKMDPAQVILASKSVVYNELNEPIMSGQTYYKEPFIRYYVLKRRKNE